METKHEIAARGPSAESRPQPAPQTAVEINHLSVSYHGRRVLEDVTLALPRGRITALIGPSGCGKTSLLSAVNRLSDLIAGCRVDGEVLIDGQDVRDGDVDAMLLRRRVGMIFQKPVPLPLSIRRNIDLPLREHGMRGRRERNQSIQRALEDVGLWPEVRQRLDEPALALSGGQQQRLCIARAAALDPEVLLLDEPCGSLDPLATDVIEQLLRSYRGRYTMLVVTHNLPQARRIADYVAFFWITGGVGRLIEHGPCRHIFESPRESLTEAYVTGRAG